MPPPRLRGTVARMKGNPTAGSAQIQQARRNAEAAADLRDRGYPHASIAFQLGVSRKTVVKYLGPERKPAMSSDPLREGADLTYAADGAHPDRRPPAPPRAEWFNNRAVSGHDQSVIEEARRAAREADAARILGGLMSGRVI